VLTPIFDAFDELRAAKQAQQSAPAPASVQPAAGADA
jgi:hypothetical protein